MDLVHHLNHGVMNVTVNHSIWHGKLQNRVDETSEISSDNRDCASRLAASTKSDKTNNSFTCVVADSGTTSYNIKRYLHVMSPHTYTISSSHVPIKGKLVDYPNIHNG